ncbi:low affinity immunoglobulin gamma Fc region receptor II-like isoform X3 [Acanthopagrus latus]|uniref:low affinity immunoglobulin gamma Fc region receptor II-like isoform X3 n=1 Tax=Acanthopagrus latus TaxID=8177 RepID=UPI00187C6B4A|nr:low affinity immunoglobulin gamma Fc region receptor II-like isoform X3 [Acanthopagrus latus]
MEVTSLCFRLLMLEFTLLGTKVQDSCTQNSDADFLHISPNRLQHFQLESISFQCTVGLLRLRRITDITDSDPKCDTTEKTSTGSSCKFDRAFSTDSGAYWCETEGGQQSNSVNITVTAGSVILESPVLPVKDGDAVTLHCRSKTSISNFTANFYKDDVLMERTPAGEMIINNVKLSDEGLYKCSIPDVGESPGSWLAVRGSANPVSITSTPPHNETLQNDSDSPHVFILLLVAVTIVTMVLVLVVVGFLHLRKRRVSGDDVADDPDAVTYAVVVTKQRTNTDKDEFSHQLVYSAVTISKTPKAPEPEPGLSSSTAATDPNSTESDVLYSAVQMVRLMEMLASSSTVL